ncbi:MAG: TfoX/Sxy family protein [Rhodospirillales bacterium]|nr:TfoX/Sxy family protein [Rhodospirillales bacterium]
MAISAEFRDHVVDMLEGAGQVTARAMFGGAGLYLDGIFMGILSNDVLYFKADEKNRADYEEAGMQPFAPYADKPANMSYLQVPAEVMDDAEELCAWARKAWEAGRRAAAEKAGKGKGKR